MIMPDMLAWAGLASASLVIGIMVGATGIGGFLIIPVLVQLVDLPIRSAMGSALVIAAANGAMGAWLFRRRGKVDWSVARPLVVGSVAFALVGGWLNRWLPVSMVVAILGCIMIAGSAANLWKPRALHSPQSPQEGTPSRTHLRTRFSLLASIGALSGLTAGLTGAGGPLVSVPLLNIMPYPVLTAVGASQVLQLAASLFGSISYWQEDLIPIAPLIMVIPMHLIGIWLGVKLVHAVDQRLATQAVAVLGMAAGIGILTLAVVR
jgi:uncharacterized membrane protein YfcA